MVSVACDDVKEGHVICDDELVFCIYNSTFLRLHYILWQIGPSVPFLLQTNLDLHMRGIRGASYR